MIYSNPVNIEIAMRWERTGGMQVSLDVDEESGIKKYAWEFGKESDGRSYLVVEGDTGRVFLSEKLCRMISTFLLCSGKHDILSKQLKDQGSRLQQEQNIAAMFAATKASGGSQEKSASAAKPQK